MQFNPNTNKQANEVIFSQESNSSNLTYPPYPLDQKHLGIVLDSKLSFNTHVAQKIKTCNKLIGLIKRLSINLPRNALLTICKSFISFIRPHLDYGDILCDNPNNESFQSKLEKVQYRACLPITGAIKGTSRESLCNELGLHSLSTRRWRSKLIFFIK